jgi:hypothetical protein
MPIGTRYNSKQIREKIPLSLKRNRISSYGMPYTISVFHLMLLATGLIKRVKKRGTFEVLGHIPDFFTYSIGEANRHVTRYKNGKRVKVNGWKLGDPPLVKESKPKVDKIEVEVKPKLMLLGQIEGCLRTKGINEAVIAMAENLGPVHVLEIMLDNPNMVQVSSAGLIDYVEIIKLKDIRIVDSKEYRKVLYPERDVVVMRDLKPESQEVMLSNIAKIGKFGENVTSIVGTDKLNIFKINFWPGLIDDKTDKHITPVLVRIVKESDDQLKKKIVSILKEGLSAVDAAEKIIKLL